MYPRYSATAAWFVSLHKVLDKNLFDNPIDNSQEEPHQENEDVEGQSSLEQGGWNASRTSIASHISTAIARIFRQKCCR